jgi:hypothetical protein
MQLLDMAGTGVWIVPRPRAPRLPVSLAAVAWLILLPAFVLSLWWCHALQRPLWPFAHQVQTPAEIILRYLIVLLVCLVYVTLQSLPRWLRSWRLAKKDHANVEQAVETQNWPQAALHLHRYCLLKNAIRRRLRYRVSQLDQQISQHLPARRRVYVYTSKRGVALPADAGVSFTPVVMPPPQPSLWSGIVLVPIGLLLYGLVLDVVRSQQWQRLMLFNTVLLIAIMVVYGGYFLFAILGTSNYIRLAPGVLQLIRYHIGRRRPTIRSFDLRQRHALLDLTGTWPILTILGNGAEKATSIRLPRHSDAIEGVFRALLSKAARPELPEDTLIE